MNTPTTIDPTSLHDSYFIHGKDHQGNERYYTLRLFAVYADGSRRQVSLTLNDWQRQANLVQKATSDFFARPVALPDSFKINMEDKWKLTTDGHKDRTIDLLDDASQVGFNKLFLQALRFHQDTLPIDPLPPEMQEENALAVNTIFDTPPVGIHNMTGKDCFISAFLHAFVFTNPELMQKLWEKRENGNEAEIGRFLYHYHQKQLEGDGPNGEKPVAQNVNTLRKAIDRSRETTNKCAVGAHDPTEVFDFLINLLQNPIEQPGSQKGYVQATPKDSDSLETCVKHSLNENKLEGDPPQHMMILNPGKTSFASVAGEFDHYKLTSFIQYTPKDGGHYIAYVKQGDNYYKCNGSTVKPSNENKFLKAAKTSRAFLYTQK